MTLAKLEQKYIVKELVIREDDMYATVVLLDPETGKKKFVSSDEISNEELENIACAVDRTGILA